MKTEPNNIFPKQLLKPCKLIYIDTNGFLKVTKIYPLLQLYLSCDNGYEAPTHASCWGELEVFAVYDVPVYVSV